MSGATVTSWGDTSERTGVFRSYVDAWIRSSVERCQRRSKIHWRKRRARATAREVEERARRKEEELAGRDELVWAGSLGEATGPVTMAVIAPTPLFRLERREGLVTIPATNTIRLVTN